MSNTRTPARIRSAMKLMAGPKTPDSGAVRARCARSGSISAIAENRLCQRMR